VIIVTVVMLASQGIKNSESRPTPSRHVHEI
jgi:hypothetical protein